MIIADCCEYKNSGNPASLYWNTRLVSRRGNGFQTRCDSQLPVSQMNFTGTFSLQKPLGAERCINKNGDLWMDSAQWWTELSQWPRWEKLTDVAALTTPEQKAGGISQLSFEPCERRSHQKDLTRSKMLMAACFILVSRLSYYCVCSSWKLIFCVCLCTFDCWEMKLTAKKAEWVMF